MHLGALKHPEASRLASVALKDGAEIIRATAVRAILALPPGEAVTLLSPLLRDKSEFVRQEAAYGLGETRSSQAVTILVAALESDKQPSVRGAAAVSLGLIGDESAVIPLTEALERRFAASGLLNKIRRRKQEENEFVRRSAARALGQIRSRVAVPTLTRLLLNEKAESDVRREAAQALGMIGDPAAVPALRAALTAPDPLLSQIAFNALLKIAPEEARRPS